MLTYFKMKRNEIKVKAMLYESIVGFMNNQKDLLNLLKKLYISLKDVPSDELRTEFVVKLAEIIHDENK